MRIENSAGCMKRAASCPHSVFGALLACTFAATMLAGCRGDGGPERVVVSGEVTYNGKLVDAGTILFEPDAKSSAPTSGATIVDGKYTANGNGGVPVGTHKVHIEAYRKPPSGGSAMPFSRGIQYLPKRYNADTTLEITVPQGSGPISKNFDLTN